MMTEADHQFVREYVNALTIMELQFVLEAKDPILFENDIVKGTKWRGGIGEQLRASCCSQKRRQCIECPALEECFYFKVFEIPLPHPYLIKPLLDGKALYKPGERIELAILLIGDSIAHQYKFVRCMEHLGEHGIGKGRGKFCVKDVWTRLVLNLGDFSEQPEPSPIRCRLLFLTPIKLQLSDSRLQYRFSSFHDFFSVLARRILSLNYYYGNGPHIHHRRVEELVRKLEKLALKIQHDDKSKWKDKLRYSSPQKRILKIGGLTDSVELIGDIGIFLPWLRIGEILGVGNDTTRGSGRFKVVAETTGVYTESYDAI